MNSDAILTFIILHFQIFLGLAIALLLSTLHIASLRKSCLSKISEQERQKLQGQTEKVKSLESQISSLTEKKTNLVKFINNKTRSKTKVEQEFNAKLKEIDQLKEEINSLKLQRDTLQDVILNLETKEKNLLRLVDPKIS